MRTQRIQSTQRTTYAMQALGAVLCAAALCLGLAALSSTAAPAHADGEEDGVATLAATENRLVGYYATVSASGTVTDPDSGGMITVQAGSSARSSSGGWINLSSYSVRISGGAAYIDEADLPALQSAMSFSLLPGASEDGITWWPLYEVVEVADPAPEPAPDPDTRDNKSTGTTTPDTDWIPDPTDDEKLPSVPEPEKKPTEPDASTDPTPQPPTASENGTAMDEPELLSLRCRESEADAKIAELQAQGYEIVRIERLPSRWR